MKAHLKTHDANRTSTDSPISKESQIIRTEEEELMIKEEEEEEEEMMLNVTD